MRRIFLNGLAASAGSGITYLHNVVPHLSASPGIHTTLVVQPDLRESFEGLAGVQVLSPPRILSTMRRFWFEQNQVPRLIKKSSSDVLISAGNFALRKSPVPQILLSGNSLYTSADFYYDLRSRRAYGLLIDNFVKGILARKSVQWADRTIVPTQAFAHDLRLWAEKKITVVRHGFDPEIFFRNEVPLSPHIKKELDRTEDCLRLLFVSHYNYYRNFETLFRALPLIQNALTATRVQLFLTCTLDPGKNPGTYDPRAAKKLVNELGITENIVELGAVPYEALHHLYRACHIYVTPAYAETFAHPLIEAMASDLPIVASDIPAHREVCGPVAAYFDRFDFRALAGKVVSTGSFSVETRSTLIAAGRQRAAEFSWSGHVQELLQIAAELCEGPNFARAQARTLRQTA